MRGRKRFRKKGVSVECLMRIRFDSARFGEDCSYAIFHRIPPQTCPAAARPTLQQVQCGWGYDPLFGPIDPELIKVFTDAISSD